MLKPHTIKKLVTMTEDQWMSIYQAAKRHGSDPVDFITEAAVAAGKKVVKS